MCRPIQCVCASLGPTKPGRDDLDSIFQERRRKITLVGKLSTSSRRCFGNVPALAPANFSLPTAFGAVRSIGCKGRGAFCTHPISKRDVVGSNPIGGFACLCRPIQCVCTSLGPTKPGRDDLDSIFQERRRKITLVGKLSKSSRRCFGNVPALAPANFSLPTAPNRQRLGLSGVSACALPSFQQPCLQGKEGALCTLAILS